MERDCIIEYNNDSRTISDFINTYIWLDGGDPNTNDPTQFLRSKEKITITDTYHKYKPWSFDGSSTNQASGSDSDVILKPVRIFPDPMKDNGSLVLCECFYPDGTPHDSNQRAKLRKVLDHAEISNQDPWFGFEQEYTSYDGRRPMGWPEHGIPGNQGPFYCGVGVEQIKGRKFSELHTKLCIKAGLMIYGTNAEVMPGQWEFQLGMRDGDTRHADPLRAADHLWVARWLLYRAGETLDISVRLDCKPEKGDWNGAGLHTNYSHKDMRDPEKGKETIDHTIDKLGKNHFEHIEDYGFGVKERLTGKHETCPWDSFKSGVANRGASIRIPRHVHDLGYGYIEDRRPGANADPYIVSRMMLETIFG